MSSVKIHIRSSSKDPMEKLIGGEDEYLFDLSKIYEMRKTEKRERREREMCKEEETVETVHGLF